MRRVFLGAAIVFFGVGALAPAVSSAATTVGQTFDPTSANTCAGGPEWDIVQTSRASGPSYATPFHGVLTSWSFQASSTTGQTTHLTMRVFRPTGTPHQYSVLADGSTFQTIAPASGLHTFATRIPVSSGDFVGVASTDGTCGTFTGVAGDRYDFHFGSALATGTPTLFTATNSGFIQDISANLEADADNDGFGDETQDKCVGTAGTTNGCPNTVTSASAAQVGKSPRITVTATVPGAGTLKAGDASDASVASASAVKLTPVTQNLTSTTSQQVPLTLSLTKQAKKKLKKKGKLKVQVKVLYTPPGGTAGAPQVLKVKLKSKKRK
jgi:hypothetical protein